MTMDTPMKPSPRVSLQAPSPPTLAPAQIHVVRWRHIATHCSQHDRLSAWHRPPGLCDGKTSVVSIKTPSRNLDISRFSRYLDFDGFWGKFWKARKNRNKMFMNNLYWPFGYRILTRNLFDDITENGQDAASPRANRSTTRSSAALAYSPHGPIQGIIPVNMPTCPNGFVWK